MDPLTDLVLERQDQEDESRVSDGILFTPPISEAYWRYRVRVGNGQAIVGFPKFLTVGIGFAQEKDWNTNLPYTVGADEIYAHIRHNKGDDSISDETCLQAIKMIQEAIAEDDLRTTEMIQEAVAKDRLEP